MSSRLTSTGGSASATRRVMFRRGTARVPGADLHRLPLRADLSGISVMEGLRTTIAAGASLFPVNWISSGQLLVMGVGALVVCFSDIGGPVRQRVPPMLLLTVLGALCWGLFGILRSLGLFPLLPVAAIFVFACSLGRVWGLAGMATGNVLTVVIALSLDEPLTVMQALHLAAAFAAGGLWATALTVLLLGSNRHRPATEAVADVWKLLIDLNRDLLALASGHRSTAEDWLTHARVHRRAVRDAVERARTILAEIFHGRHASASPAMVNLLRLEIAERLFGALIVLSDLIEHDRSPTTRTEVAQVLRRLSRLLPKLGGPDRIANPDRVARAIARLGGHPSPAPAMNVACATIAEWGRVALRLKQDLDIGAARSLAQPPPVERTGFWEPLRANLTWNSAILRHAVRVTVATVPAMAFALVFWSPYSHWLSYSVALTMQPFFSASWQRVLERGGGTMVGALIGGALAFLPHTPMAHAALLLPLCIIGFSARQVSYGAFIACMTPLVVLLFDIADPGHEDWTIALMRVAYTVAGGAITMAASFLLWPSWEPRRLREAFKATRLAYAAFAADTAARLEGGGDHALAQSRRFAGVQTNNFEASLSRALQEPRGGRGTALRSLLLADGAFRRLGALLMTLEHAASHGSEADRTYWRAWLSWLAEALTHLDGRRQGASPPLPERDDLARDAEARVQAHLALLQEASVALEREG